MIILKSGDVARFETVRDGLIPCKVMSIDRCVPSNVVLKITRDRAGYHAGDEIVTLKVDCVCHGGGAAVESSDPAIRYRKRTVDDLVSDEESGIFQYDI